MATTWAAGGNLSQGGYGNSTLGTQNDAINFGGNLTKGKKAQKLIMVQHGQI